MKNIKKVFMLVTSLGLALGMASAAWGDNTAAERRLAALTNLKQTSSSSTTDKTQQELPDTITVDGVEYKKVRMMQ